MTLVPEKAFAKCFVTLAKPSCKVSLLGCGCGRPYLSILALAGPFHQVLLWTTHSSNARAVLCGSIVWEDPGNDDRLLVDKNGYLRLVIALLLTDLFS